MIGKPEKKFADFDEQSELLLLKKCGKGGKIHKISSKIILKTFIPNESGWGGFQNIYLHPREDDNPSLADVVYVQPLTLLGHMLTNQ